LTADKRRGQASTQLEQEAGKIGKDPAPLLPDLPALPVQSLGMFAGRGERHAFFSPRRVKHPFSRK
jgi:hypothetical protein